MTGLEFHLVNHFTNQTQNCINAELFSWQTLSTQKLITIFFKIFYFFPKMNPVQLISSHRNDYDQILLKINR